MMDDNFCILQTLKDNKSDVTSCDFGGNYTLAIGSSDKTVRILEWKKGLGFVDVSFSPLQCHKYGVTWVRFSPQGTMLASSSVDGTTILWNVKTGIKIHTMVQATKSSVRRCEFTPDSTKLVTAGDDGVFCFWDLVHRTHISKHYLHNDEDACVQGLAISPDSEYLLTGDSIGLMKLWPLSDINLNHLQPIHLFKNVHDGINSCEFSPKFEITDFDTFNYKYTFATCGRDGLIKIWNLEVKRNPKLSPNNHHLNCDIYVSKILRGHENDILNCRFNMNGSLIASTGLDKTVKLWQVNNGDLLKDFTGHTRYVNCCAFSKSSALLASGSNDRSLLIWDLNKNFNLDSELMKKCSTCSHFTGNTPMCLLAEELVIHQSENDVNRLELLQTLNLTSCVNTAYFSGNDLLATAGGDKAVSLWRRKPGEVGFTLYNVLEGHRYSINQVEISLCGTKLISCSMNGTTIIWDLQTGLNYEMRSPDCINSLRSCRFSPNSEFIAAAGDDQKVFLWDAKNLEFIKKITDVLMEKIENPVRRTLQEHKDAVTSVAFSPDSKLIASTCCAGDLKVYDLETDQYYAVKDGIHDLGANCCDFSSQKKEPSGDENPSIEYVLATCGNDSLIAVWKLRLNQLFDWRKLSTHGGNVSYVRFSPKVPHLLASCATDYTVRLWNVELGTCLHVFDHHENIVTTCAFSQKSNLLASGSLDKKVVIWTLPDENGFERTVLNQKSRKSLEHWNTSDIVEWLSELGFTNASQKAKNTTLNGQQLLGLKIKDIVDIMEIDGAERKSVSLHLYWIRNEMKRNPNILHQSEEVPHQFLCPITHEIMTDPVVCSDGFTYERGAIIEWLLCGKCTSPMTNEPLRDLKFLPNTTLKTSILKYLYGEEVRELQTRLSETCIIRKSLNNLINVNDTICGNNTTKNDDPKSVQFSAGKNHEWYGPWTASLP